MRGAVCSAAPAAAGLWLAASPVSAQSVWDTPARIAPPPPQAHHTAEYRVEEAAPVDVWSGTRSTWTAIDAQGRDLRPAPAAPTYDVTPARPPIAAAPRPTFVPLPEAVIRSSLQAATPPMTAGSLLRGATAAPRAEEAPTGVARLLLTAPPQGFAAEAMDVATLTPGVVEPQPTATDTAPVASEAPVREERAYSLFDPPSVVEGRAFQSPLSAELDWQQYAFAGLQEGGGTALLAPPMSGSRTNQGRDAGEAVVLDGLDAVNGQGPAQPDPYLPRPMSQIRPYKNYTPQGIELCPSPDARCPEIKELPGSLESTERYFAHLDFMWVPANVFYSPLYFEDPQLERYGHTHGPLLQPLASSARFGVQLIGLPYQIALDPPHRRVYPLGFYQPGECAPKQVPAVPLNAKAAVGAGAVYTGLIFAFP